MNTFRSLIIFACFALSTSLFAQPNNLVGNLQFTIKNVSGQTWAVYVKPDNTIAPSTRTSVGSGQVTIVAPVDFTYANLKNVSGTWVENARVNGPVEATEKAYISFGFVIDEPKINLYPTEETLLFSFTTAAEFNGTFGLFENANDAFAVPNSYGSNPGNDFGMIDFGVAGGLQYYTYANNYGTAQGPAILANNQVKSQGQGQAKAKFVSEAAPK